VAKYDYISNWYLKQRSKTRHWKKNELPEFEGFRKKSFSAVINGIFVFNSRWLLKLVAQKISETEY
jgi:hypothetical protein